MFPLNLTGLAAKLARNGGVDLTNAAGHVVALIPQAFMHDSSFQKRSGSQATSTAVTYRLVTIHGEPAIKMTASKAWLDDPSRVYPVTVDPSFEASGTTYVLSGFPGDWSVNEQTIVGTWDNGVQIGISFFAFAGLGSALAGERITSASMNVFDRWASTCSAEPSISRVSCSRTLAPAVSGYTGYLSGLTV